MYNTGFLLSVSFAVSRYSSLLTACTWHPLTKTEQKYMSLQLTAMLTDEGNLHTQRLYM